MVFSLTNLYWLVYMLLVEKFINILFLMLNVGQNVFGALRRHSTVIPKTAWRAMSTLTTPPCPAVTQIQPQNFDYFLILDFEATCDTPQINPMEVIEFPVLKMDARTFEVVDRFHRYVKPTVNPMLSPFCVNLTGILQEMVDQSSKFNKVFIDFQRWLQETALINEWEAPISRFTFITCGDWDLKRILPLQCRLCGIEVPLYMRSWINVKKSFTDQIRHWPTSQAYLLQYFDIEPIGRAHSGIDDCYNLAQIVRELALRGHVYQNNSKLKQD